MSTVWLELAYIDTHKCQQPHAYKKPPSRSPSHWKAFYGLAIECADVPEHLCACLLQLCIYMRARVHIHRCVKLCRLIATSGKDVFVTYPSSEMRPSCHTAADKQRWQRLN